MRTTSGMIAPVALALAMMSGQAWAADPAAVAKLKREIVAIAKSNQLRQDNISEVRAEIEPLVKDLLTLVPSQPERAEQALVVGGWRNLWSDMLFPPTVDLSQNYQVVTAKGYYYNVSRQTLFGAFPSTGLLRGQYRDAGDYLNIEFTRNALAEGWPAPGTKLLTLAENAESGALASVEIPGPTGVTGKLKDAYVDADLRIITGGDSLGEAGLIYVMARADSIEAQ